MIWRSVTCFSLAIFLALAAAHAATVSGAVSLRDSRVDAVNKHRDYSGIVISLVPVNGTVAMPAPKHATMTQKNKMFMPHLLPVLAGTTVDFPNFDPIFHSAFSNYSGQTFDVGLYKPGTSKTVVFTRPGIVRVFCNIHPTMSAVIVVLDTPWFAVSDAGGSFRVADVPPGEYGLKVFYERALPDALGQLDRHILVEADDVTLPDLRIVDAGYVAPPHKNKFGKDYPPIIVDQYPGGRR